MSSYWVNFAKIGEPNLPGLPQWGAYKPNGGGMVMELGTEIVCAPSLAAIATSFSMRCTVNSPCNDRTGGTTVEPRPGVKAMRRQEGPAARTAAKHASAAAADRHRSRPGSNLS
jgi:hypothetical protein